MQRISTVSAVPSIETERLIFRGHRLEDLEGCAALWADAHVTRYIGGKPFTREEVWTKLLRYLGHWSLMGFGFWVVTEKSSGSLVGEGGLADFKGEIQPPIGGEPEGGWVLAREPQGEGVAGGAIRAAAAGGDGEF